MGNDLFYRLRVLLGRKRFDGELDEELAYHLERQVEKNRSAGMPDAEAIRLARLSLGGLEQVRQQVREGRGVRLVDDVVRDMRFALRQLRRSPVYTLTALVTLTLAIGAAITMMSLVRTVLLAPLPYPLQDRLVGVAYAQPGQPANNEQTGATANFVIEHARSFATTGVYVDTTSGANLAVGNDNASGAVQVAVQAVDHNFFPTLGIAPVIGRNFTVDEDRATGPKAIILSYGLWQRMFAGDRGVVDRVVHLNGESFVVAGVMPESMAFGSDDPRSLSAVADVWQPLKLDEKNAGYPGKNYNMIARLRDGVTIAQAQEDVSALVKPLYKAMPYLAQWVGPKQTIPELRVWPLREVMVSNVRSSIVTLTAAVIAVLLVACLNLAGLNVARASRRQREMALRSALGASRGAVVRLLLAESFLLAMCGSMLGIVASMPMLHMLLARSPVPILRAGLSMIATVWLTPLLVFAVTLMCGLAPSWMVLRRNTASNLKAGHSVGASAADGRMSKVLLVSQTAIAVVLLSAASLLLAVFLRLRATPSGVQPEHLTVAQVNLKGSGYASTLETTQFIDKVLGRLAREPGVKHVAAINGLLLDRGLNIAIPPTGKNEQLYIVELRLVTPGYFAAVGTPLLAGRDIADTDKAGGPTAVVVSEAFAKKLWPGKSAIGEHIDSLRDKVTGPPVVVGVVGNARTHSLAEPPALLIYEAFQQQPDKTMKALNGWFRTSFAIRSAADVDMAAGVEAAIREADAGIPISRYTTMQAIIDRSLARPKFFSSLVTAFAGFALVLTVIGLFGLLSYQVSERTREIGVRIALGATRARILGFVLQRGLFLTMVGLVVGTGASLLLPRLLRSLLDSSMYTAGAGASASSWSTAMALATACCAMVAAAVLASYFPARRASAIEPLEALRME
ncbi:ADOP family duplicated permease [Granulicella sp. dw_53]|uniref:ADOP family duplicated permease n=1 Tax=Granulicella sp. dw_53 TaxID=2719792 RepID=UPI001BD2E045|nr:ADOP family duplicated permease [Granulicella sp. dw_53]